MFSCWYTLLIGKLFGTEVALRFLPPLSPSTYARILATLGAKIGRKTLVYQPIAVHRSQTNLQNLLVGSEVHIGREVFIDLTDKVKINTQAVISFRSVLITHFNPGQSELRNLGYPPSQGPITIGRGAYIGALTTVLPGITIGEKALVGAGSVVTKNVPPNTVWVGNPAKQIKTIKT